MGELNIECGRDCPKAYGVRAVMRFREGRLLMGGVFHVLTLLPKGIRFCAANRHRGMASKVGWLPCADLFGMNALSANM